jgi:hypothetical protein
MLTANQQTLEYAREWLTEAYDKKERREWWGLALEITVVALILWEIRLGIVRETQDTENFKTQQVQQKKNFEDQQKVLSNMLSSSRDTAATMSTLQSTTQTMSDSLQKQLGLFYDVSLIVMYNSDTKVMAFQNNGRTNVVLWGISSLFLNKAPVIVAKEGRVLVPNGVYSISLPELYTEISGRYPVGSTTLVPFEVYVKNERQEEFVVHCKTGVTWDKDKLVLTTQLVSISPEHWSRTFHPVVIP